MIVDPPDGRVPPLTPEAQKTAAADREFRLALMQATETCKNQLEGCAGGKYDPTPSPRRAELSPRYNTARMNRQDGPEDGALAERCLTGGLPEFGAVSFRRIVQTPGGISIFYDVGQGQGWQRNIVMDGSPHLPAEHPPVVRQLARPLGGQHARHRRDELQSEDRLSRLAREPASGRALDAHRSEHARIRRHDRRPDRVDEALDRQAGVHQAERRRRTGSIPSRAASKAMSASPRSSRRRVWKIARLPRAKVPIRQPGTTHRDLPKRTRCSEGDRHAQSFLGLDDRASRLPRSLSASSFRCPPRPKRRRRRK